MNLDSKILVTGASGLVGQALVRVLYERLGHNHVTVPPHAELDLTEQAGVNGFFDKYRPEYIFHCAAKVGGIVANATLSAKFIATNLRMQLNVIEAAHRTEVKRLLFFGSSCAYPKFAPVPVQETALLTGELEPTNRAYAIAKIAGIEMCDAFRSQFGDDFISCMPTNLYGIGDHYDLENSHVLPGMIRRFHEAKVAGAPSVTLWGTGTPTREFLFADDLAEAAVVLMNAAIPPRLVNVTSGREIALKDLAWIVAQVVGYKGEVIWDASKPDGTPRRVLDNAGMKAMGWQPQMPLETGIQHAYDDYVSRV